MPPFIFDFTLNKVTINNSISNTEAVACNKIDTGSRSPFIIPKLNEIYKLIDKAYGVDKNRLITDTIECGAIAISNQVDLTRYEEREKRYLEIINKYKPDEQNLITELFGKLFALLTSPAYDNGAFDDYLGELFMHYNLGNGNRGQIFTPFHISEMMARMTLDSKEIKEKADKDEIITINDPCCGSGVMSLGCLDVFKNQLNINYARNAIFICEDIDIRCVYMTYLQLALAGAPAIIKHENTLTRECWDVWKTPAFIFQYHRFHQFENYA